MNSFVESYVSLAKKMQFLASKLINHPMKNHLFVASALLVLTFFSSCNKKSDPTPAASDWLVNTSELTEASEVEGNIINQNNGPLVNYQVATSYIRPLNGNTHIFKFYFTSKDSLTCYVEKITKDFNYHSDATDGQNKLSLVVFNQDTLQLKSSAISIQPRQEENKFHTVSNIHSQSKGDFNGTVNKVPLVK